MKTKKIVIAVLTAALLLSVLLIVGCYDQLSGLNGLSGKDAEDNYPIPEGKGIVRLKVVEPNIRTILPVAPALNAMVYDLSITNANPSIVSSNKTEVKCNYAKIQNDYSLLVLVDGSYSISIIAYTASESIPDSGTFDVFTSIASWDNDSTNFTVTGGESTPLVAVLKPNDTTGEGTFAFNITPSSNGVTTFDICNYNSSSSIGTSYPGYVDGVTGDLYDFPETLSSATGSDSVTLASGYYLVVVKSVLASHQTIEYTHVLHIYANMKSTMEPLQMPTLVKNEFVVTYNLNNVSDSGNNYTSNVSTENIKFGNYAVKGKTQVPANSSYNFEGWFTAASAPNGTKVDFTDPGTRIIDDLPVFARWTAKGTDLGLSFSVEDPTSVALTGEINQTKIFNGTVTPIQFILTAGSATLSNIKWRISTNITHNDLVTAGRISNTNVNGDTLTINDNQIFWQLLAEIGNEFPISVSADVTKDGDTKPYGRIITITVVDTP